MASSHKRPASEVRDVEQLARQVKVLEDEYEDTLGEYMELRQEYGVPDQWTDDMLLEQGKQRYPQPDLHRELGRAQEQARQVTARRAQLNARLSEYSMRELLETATRAEWGGHVHAFTDAIDARLDEIEAYVEEARDSMRVHHGQLVSEMYDREFSFEWALRQLDEFLQYMTPRTEQRMGFIRHRHRGIMPVRDQLQQLARVREQYERMRATAFMMATHPRLGSESQPGDLEAEILREQILGRVYPSSFGKT